MPPLLDNQYFDNSDEDQNSIISGMGHTFGTSFMSSNTPNFEINITQEIGRKKAEKSIYNTSKSKIKSLNSTPL